MREIEYRVYDKTGGYYVAVLGNDCFGLKQVARIIFELEHLKHEYVIEQYTGLKDENGKEICEGDIVRYVSEGEGIYLAVIKRKDEDKELSYWLTGFVYEPFATVDEEELTEEEYESLGGMEIIGNINENPELLKKEK